MKTIKPLLSVLLVSFLLLSTTSCLKNTSGRFVGTYSGTISCGGGISGGQTIAISANGLSDINIQFGADYIKASVSGNSFTINSGQMFSGQYGPGTVGLTGSGYRTGNSRSISLTAHDVVSNDYNNGNFTGKKI